MKSLKVYRIITGSAQTLAYFRYSDKLKYDSDPFWDILNFHTEIWYILKDG